MYAADKLNIKDKSSWSDQICAIQIFYRGSMIHDFYMIPAREPQPVF